MAHPRTIALGLGSSLGDRHRTLALTIARLRVTPGIRVERVSHWVRTPPLAGGHARNWFLNGVARLRTTWDPHELLDLCIHLEAAAGRRRGLFWADRPLDLDILVVGHEAIDTQRLTVPHPAIRARRFVLEPLLEIWPDVMDARTGRPYGGDPAAAGIQPALAGLLARTRRLRYL